MAQTGETPTTIYLFLPNIIDYLRIIFALISFYFMPTDPLISSVCYLFSGLLDAFDGHVARAFNQCSKLGGMLDMLIDRVTTMCLCAALCHFYPRYMFLFQLSMGIDIMSHWFHLHSSLLKGAASHKVLDLSDNPILRHYYHNKYILFTMCAANELFYCMLYLCYFTPGPTLLSIGWLTVGLWQLILYICAPLSFVKTGISVIHLVAACQKMASIDVAERAKLKEKAN
ncbi:hypothetical protein ACJMK2_010965 [Sinanodonta woodiana]|uniref:CDP-diacylglycerol--inositol 3-phosphatidyltransferase n=1 Tax=Sinanodonta woodiana TaxID=1069815 RepID=A0ABD3V6F1_SINWO